jgi:hypothetical protein
MLNSVERIPSIEKFNQSRFSLNIYAALQMRSSDARGEYGSEVLELPDVKRPEFVAVYNAFSTTLIA